MAFGPELSSVKRGAAGIAGEAKQVTPWVERLARVGFAAKALLYTTVGVLAARLAVGMGGRTTDQRGALKQVFDAPLGKVLVAVIAAGLVGAGIWRLMSAVTDAEDRGTDAKGWSLRAAAAGNGILHLALAVTAVRLLMGRSRGAGGGDRAQEATSKALALPGGEWLVMGVGAAILAFGLYQLYRGWKAKLTKQLFVDDLSPENYARVVAISRFGIAARGVVAVVIGVLAIMAGVKERSSQATGIQGALDTLLAFGRWPLLVVALGLVAYGAYELLQARYRRIRAT